MNPVKFLANHPALGMIAGFGSVLLDSILSVPEAIASFFEAYNLVVGGAIATLTLVGMIQKKVKEAKRKQNES